jgi:hypothetical protein
MLKASSSARKKMPQMITTRVSRGVCFAPMKKSTTRPALKVAMARAVEAPQVHKGHQRGDQRHGHQRCPDGNVNLFWNVVFCHIKYACG